MRVFNKELCVDELGCDARDRDDAYGYGILTISLKLKYITFLIRNLTLNK
jgi:hypothetical protein